MKATSFVDIAAVGNERNTGRLGCVVNRIDDTEISHAIPIKASELALQWRDVVVPARITFQLHKTLGELFRQRSIGFPIESLSLR